MSVGTRLGRDPATGFWAQKMETTSIAKQLRRARNAGKTRSVPAQRPVRASQKTSAVDEFEPRIRALLMEVRVR